MTKLLLIDREVKANALIAAKKSDVDHIIFNAAKDTYESLKLAIKAKGVTYTDIAIVQHGTKKPYYTLLLTEKPGAIYEPAPYTSFDDFKAFVCALKTDVGLQRLDLLACALYKNIKMQNIIASIESSTGVDFRASINFTGNPESGGDWVMESDNIDIRTNYFTEKINTFKGALYSSANTSTYGSGKLIRDVCGNVVYIDVDISGIPIKVLYDASGHQIIKNPAKIGVWGDIYDGGSREDDLNNGYTGISNIPNIIAIYSTRYAYAALKADRTVVVWGDLWNGGAREDNLNDGYTGIPADLSNVKAIYSTSSAFAALKYDGTVAVWGSISDGGAREDVYNTWNNELESTGIPADLSNVKEIYSSYSAFAALKNDGTIAVWGSIWDGGAREDVYNTWNNTISNYGLPSDLSNVVAIYSTDSAFAALKSDGTVAVWGDLGSGAAREDNGWYGYTGIPSDLSNVKMIFSSPSVFAALKNDGTVAVWGSGSDGGAREDGSWYNAIPVDLSNVKMIYPAYSAFAALKEDGTVAVWGQKYDGGAREDGSDYNGLPTDLSNVVSIYSNSSAFAALKNDGTVAVWGNLWDGGAREGNPSQYIAVPSDLSNVKAIYSTRYAFVALKSDGTLTNWGNQYDGGAREDDAWNGYTGLTSNIVAKEIFSTEYAFAAIKSDNTVYVWGNISNGGAREDNIPDEYTGVPNTTNAQYIYATRDSFAVLGEVVYGTQPVPCFVKGTRILTSAGEKLIESLGSGDLIVTSAGKVVPIKAMYFTDVVTSKTTAPYKIPARTFGKHQPNAITLSPRHAIEVKKGIWEIPEFAAARYPQIKQEAVGKKVTYYHLELPNYFTDNVVANGCVTESFGVNQIDCTKPLYGFNSKLGGFIRMQNKQVVNKNNGCITKAM